ncbi:MAG TPA: 6-phospho-beta-glucosidase [Actinomycetes bacterium]|nr:6-phospho-beta-glucosidase [Actinomycetes bacterium]
MRLTVVGGGSTYTPELVEGLARRPAGLPEVSELVLVDPNPDRLEIIGGLATRMLAKQSHPARVVCTGDLAAGAAGAGAVLIQIRVGGQAARASDESFPLKCGCIGQETTGAGGFAKALRTVPVALDIARTAAEVAPDAWLINFTNPVGIVTRALLDDGHRAVGLCNVAIGFQRFFAGMLHRSPDDIVLDHAGLNHLTWVRRVLVDGSDVLPRLLAERLDEIATHVELPAPLIAELAAVPSYYLRYFYAHDTVLAEQRDAPSRAEQVAAIERELLVQCADPRLAEKPALLSQRGGAFYSEAALGLLAGLLGAPGSAPQRHVVNTRNVGTLPFLPDDAVVEVPALVGPDGAEPVPPAAPLNPGQAGLVGHVTGYEELALAAARSGGRQRITAALLAHPLVGQYERAECLTDLLLAANREYLPWLDGR